jgi:hypothetical protein
VLGLGGAHPFSSFSACATSVHFAVFVEIINHSHLPYRI